MGKPLDTGTFAGAHPTAREFYEQLLAWGFTQRRPNDGSQLVLRGPHGGTVRVLRSLVGRADGELVDKAARLAGATPEEFWIGLRSTNQPATSAQTDEQERPVGPRSRTPKGHDSYTSLVLSAHVRACRPLGFEDVVALCPAGITRAQVRTASAALCRDGDLERVRPGAYQWAGCPSTGVPAGHSGLVPLQGNRRGDSSAASAAAEDAYYSMLASEPDAPTPERRQELRARAEAATADKGAEIGVVELFSHLFPGGVTMTAENFADFQRWADLTRRLGDQTRLA